MSKIKYRLFTIQYILLFLLVAALLPGCHKQSSSDSSSIDFCQDSLMKEILEKVQEEYVERPDERKMREGAISGMLNALDPYSTYMNQETYELFKESTVGEFGGIGVEVLFMDDSLRVIAPIDDTPAAKAGLQHGDYIVKVDDESITSFTQVKLFKKLHGKPGAPVKLTIQRGDQDPFDLTLERAVITINPIKYKRDGNIGYIRISYFNEKTTEKLKEAIQAIQKEGPLSGAIIDLRNNPGGTLDQAVNVTSLFIDKGKIVEVKSRAPKKNIVYESTDRQEMLRDVPLIVLVNNGSASASEIMAGALKDHKRAIILGKTTLGKGSVQGLFSLEGRGAIKLTISRFYTPLGHEIQGKGIAPDIVVESGPVVSNLVYTKDESKLIADDDQQLNRALDMLKGMELLKGH
ncbi:S41 family peptidase [Candidatus Paracaedibacter symbiosus]|uniref:S41 family peptidase n=1 Tax=Candidatus Paracaedibacter symbiosus TaxID=244582 RepID=UPI000509B9DA|nr:S41 family peptidase [Candidatus Paracaedibacter symbiosus]